MTVNKLPVKPDMAAPCVESSSVKKIYYVIMVINAVNYMFLCFDCCCSVASLPQIPPLAFVRSTRN